VPEHSIKISFQRRLAFPVISVLVGLLLVPAGLLLSFEIAVRYATDINFLGISANLFSPGRFGPSRGNASNVHAISFGEDVYTDANGFRVPSPMYTYSNSAERHLLIVGDSIAFGVGVDEPLTFPGLLRQLGSNRGWNVYNTAVIGYDIEDYLNVVRALLDRQPITKVLLFYCLNDISSQSARRLDAANEPKARALADRFSPVELATTVNEFLRERSKLFLYLKGTLTDPSARYFFADHANYKGPDDTWRKLEPLGRLTEELQKREIGILVIICPYEYQLRRGVEMAEGQSDIFLPQRTVGAYLDSRGIPYRDATNHFVAHAYGNGARFFLAFDPMHFSVEGHRAMFYLVSDVLN
jgi:lysophospholipase L1-like esterase